MTKTPAVEMHNIHKRFGTVIASRGVNFTLAPGEIHALLGENGAGKSTLMRILYGLYHADVGEIHINGRPVTIQSPKEAIAHGIGMVTQHFALALPLTVTENVILGYTKRFRLELPAAQTEVAAAAARFGISVDPTARVGDLSVGERQRVEILKALYRNARVLILDEPTAVLAPQEADQLFASLARLREDGLSVIFISHKMHEVMAITDRVTVVRGGTTVGTVETAGSSEADLAQMMVGRVARPVAKGILPDPSQPRLILKNITAQDSKGLTALKGLSLQVHAGEIVGIAGVSGNGQRELAQVLDGTHPITTGELWINNQAMVNASPATLMQVGVGRIPEDRHASVVGEMSVAQNMALEHLDEFTQRGVLAQQKMHSHAEQLIADYQIKAAPDDKIRTLSGGNMQKVILARVLERNPQVLIVAQPTRGLDIGATEYVRGKLVEQQQRGAAILLISEDLDEIMELADRIAVLYEGQIMDILPAADATAERLGLLMAGIASQKSIEGNEHAVTH